MFEVAQFSLHAFLWRRNEPGAEGEGRKGSALAVSKEGVQNVGVFEETYLLRRKSPGNQEDFEDPPPVVHKIPTK